MQNALLEPWCSYAERLTLSRWPQSRKPPAGRAMWSRCSHPLDLVQTLSLRFEDEDVESQYLRHIATRGPGGCLLGCFVFFWPWTAWELGALMNESGGEHLSWTRIAHYSAAFSLTAAASLLTFVTWLSWLGQARWLAEFLYLELLWVLLGAGGFTVLASTQHQELAVGAPPNHEWWVAALAVVVLCCWPVRCQISWLTLLAAILTSSFDGRISWQNGTLLCGFLACVCRLSWLAEKYHRYSWLRQLEEESNKPVPPNSASPILPMLCTSEASSSRGDANASIVMDERLFRKDMSLKKSASSGKWRSQVHKTSSASNIPGMVEGHLFSSARDISREASMSQDVFPAMSSRRSEKMNWVILPLQQDLTVREVPFEVRLQIGYDIAGKHLSCIFEQTPDFDFHRMKEPFYCLSVHLRLAMGPTKATLCLLRTGLVEPAWLAMFHSISEESESYLMLQPAPSLTSESLSRDRDRETGPATYGRRRSSPAALSFAKVEVPSLRNLQQRIRGPKREKVNSCTSVSGISPSHASQLRRGESAASAFLTGSLAYSVDSSLPVQTNFDFGATAEVETQTDPTGVDASSQTLQIGEARCRKCARPPRPTKQRRPHMSSKSAAGPDADMENEVTEVLSHAQALLMVIQGGWQLHAGPDDTAPWLKSFTINDFVAESQEDFIEITIENGKLVMAGGELSLDEDGFLHRYGRSGSHLMYIRLEDPVFTVHRGSF